MVEVLWRGPDGRHVRDARSMALGGGPSQAVRYGNRVTVVPPDGRGTADLAPVMRQFGRPKVGQKFSVLSVNESDLAALDSAPGAWVLNLHARITKPAEADWYGNLSNICPLVAILEVGGGGTSMTYELDAFRASIPLPAQEFRLFVQYEAIGWYEFQASGPSWPRFCIPDEVEVTAVVQRANVRSVLAPTRSYYVPWMPPTTALGGKNNKAGGPVPVGAQRMRIISTRLRQAHMWEDRSALAAEQTKFWMGTFDGFSEVAGVSSPYPRRGLPYELDYIDFFESAYEGREFSLSPSARDWGCRWDFNGSTGGVPPAVAQPFIVQFDVNL